MTAYKARRGTTPLILNLSARRQWVVNIMPRPLYLGKAAHNPLHRKQGGPNSMSGRFAENKIFWPLAGFETQCPTTDHSLRWLNQKIFVWGVTGFRDISSSLSIFIAWTMRYYFITNFPQQTSFQTVSVHLEFDSACFSFTSVAFPSSIVAAVFQFEVASLCLPTNHFVLLPYQWFSPFTLQMTSTTVLLVLSTYTYYQQSLNSEHIKRYSLQSNVSPISAREAIMLTLPAA